MSHRPRRSRQGDDTRVFLAPVAALAAWNVMACLHREEGARGTPRAPSGTRTDALLERPQLVEEQLPRLLGRVGLVDRDPVDRAVERRGGREVVVALEGNHRDRLRTVGVHLSDRRLVEELARHLLQLVAVLRIDLAGEVAGRLERLQLLLWSGQPL